MTRPNIDIHCDLLIYLTRATADINTKDEIGASLPHLKAGNVKLQTMAIFEATEAQSHKSGIRQSQIFKDLVSNEKYSEDFYEIRKHNLRDLADNPKIGLVASIENASAFCDEEISLRQGFNNLEEIISNVCSPPPFTKMVCPLTHSEIGDAK